MSKIRNHTRLLRKAKFVVAHGVRVRGLRPCGWEAVTAESKTVLENVTSCLSPCMTWDGQTCSKHEDCEGDACYDPAVISRQRTPKEKYIAPSASQYSRFPE